MRADDPEAVMELEDGSSYRVGLVVEEPNLAVDHAGGAVVGWVEFLERID